MLPASLSDDKTESSYSPVSPDYSPGPPSASDSEAAQQAEAKVDRALQDDNVVRFADGEGSDNDDNEMEGPYDGLPPDRPYVNLHLEEEEGNYGYRSESDDDDDA